MSRAVTLLQLRNKIRFQADLVGATVRHPDADLTTLVNDSIQEFREAISNEGNQHYLVPYSGTLTAGATSPYSFGSLDLSAISPAVVRTYGLDITVDGVVRSLDHRPFTERNIWGGPATTGTPRHWAHYQTAKLAIQPAPNAAFPYTLWYLPVLADLSADGDTFDGVAGWEMWIVWDVVCRLLIRDQQGAAFASAKVYKDDAWSRIHRQATRVSSAGGAVVGRDTLRGRIPDPLAVRGTVMAGGGPPATHSINLDMLAEVTGPVFLGRVVGTGDVTAMAPADAASILPTFTPSAAGLVPAAGGSSITKFLSQAGTFETVTGGGGGGGSPGGQTGTIQFNGLSGFVGWTGFAVQGAFPSLTVRVPGSVRVTGGSVDVGSGTVRMSASGIDLGGGQLANVSSLFAFPTFAAGVPGLVPASDSDSSKFLNAAGAFAVPPGTAVSVTPGGGFQDVQFNNGNGGFAGASGLRLLGSGSNVALAFGNPAAAALGDVRFATGFDIRFADPSGLAANARPFAQWIPGGVTGTFDWGSSSLQGGRMRHNVGTGGEFRWWFGGASATKAELFATGFDLTNFHVHARSLAVTEGVANSQLAAVPSGTVKGSLSSATPSDLSIPTLAAFFPTFTANRAGLVAPGDGDANKFLNAAGAFAAPPVGGTPTGIALNQLAPIATPRLLGRISTPSGIPEELIPTLVATLLPVFSDTGRGMVPPSGGGLTSFLRADQTFAAPTGFTWTPTGLPNANLAVMPSGTVKANLTGTGAPADVLIPTLFMHAPTMTSSRAGIVGPGGGVLTSFLRGDGAFAAPTGFVSVPTGLLNANLAPMPSGTVKANLSGTSVPSDLIIPTLAAFFPTFTSNRPGLVAPGDGDTGKFLNAAGAFATPVAAATPGGDSGNVQWNNGGAMAGASAIHALAGGAALGLGPAASVADRGDFRVASGFSIMARNPSGVAQPLIDYSPTGTLRVGSSALPRQLSEVASGGVQEFAFGGATASTARLTPSGFDLSSFHIKAKSIDVQHVNGQPFTWNNTKRGADIFIASGLSLYLPRGASTGANRFVVPSGALGTNISIILQPTGGRGGNVIRVERVDASAGQIDIKTPTGTILYSMPSGTKHFADFQFDKTSGAVFQLAGAMDMH